MQGPRGGGGGVKGGGGRLSAPLLAGPTPVRVTDCQQMPLLSRVLERGTTHSIHYKTSIFR